MSLALHGFIVNANSFDGATENRSAMNQDLTLSLKDVLPELMEETSNDAGEDTIVNGNGDRDISCSYPSDKDMEQYLKDEARHWDHRVLKRYTLNELPFEMMVAYPHPIYKDIFIAAAADMSHCCKKQVNAMELSGKENSKRDLHLDGLPIQLRMGYDAYKQSDDFLHEGSLADYVKLGTDVFEKTSKSRMRFGLAARALGQTMKQCILSNGPKVKHASWSMRQNRQILWR